MEKIITDDLRNTKYYILSADYGCYDLDLNILTNNELKLQLEKIADDKFCYEDCLYSIEIPTHYYHSCKIPKEDFIRNSKMFNFGCSDEDAYNMYLDKYYKHLDEHNNLYRIRLLLSRYGYKQLCHDNDGYYLCIDKDYDIKLYIKSLRSMNIFDEIYLHDLLTDYL